MPALGVVRGVGGREEDYSPQLAMDTLVTALGVKADL